ncbi:terminase large subunit domain-containing protein [Anatilimnocola floriformis]|uniref:terminase large subunit domain-containing protein n=1 Tax=Anatilimnocola floriformis TaxID=2948575 RepID=UPI0020C2AB99|nr:terminase family protein [Anatilimnocola floriformis]
MSHSQSAQNLLSTEAAEPTQPKVESSRPVAWVPHRPWPKQQTFMQLTCLEALYGGAAGGGKSEALLMAALEHVHVPGYAALILRRDTQRLNLAGGLIPRSHEWLSGKGATWSSAQKRWTFPTGAEPATLTFGYLRDRHDKYRYGSSEFQFIAFDELTEFPEEDYLFLFSRLRRKRGLHAPLRIRSASNPGNIGHLWVRSRFIHPDYLAHGTDQSRAAIIWHQDRAYVPAQIGDNPALDEQEYRQSLVHLPPLARERLMHGDWTIQEQGLIQSEWLRYFQTTGAGAEIMLHLLSPPGEIVQSIAARDCRRFVTIDPAGTSADRARERQGRSASWSVAQVWDQPRGPFSKLLILRDQARERVGFDGLCRMLMRLHEEWRPGAMWIENEKLGQAAVDVLKNRLPLRTIATQARDKVARAALLLDKLTRGEVFLPQQSLQWRPTLEAEWLAWTGDPLEAADQIDAAAYAAILGNQQPSGPVSFSMLTLPLFSRTLP